MDCMFDKYEAAMAALHGYAGNADLARGVLVRRQEAVVYAWGWQDGRGDTDTQVSTDFGYAYGIVAAEYMMGKRGSRPNVAAAWREYRETGAIS